MFLPGDYENYAFQHGAVSGAMAAGLTANSEIYQFRWPIATAKARILAVSISASVGATGFTAGPANFSLTRAFSWTVAGSGGSDVTPALQDCSLRTGNMNGTGKPRSLLVGNAGSINVATTAALVAGTKTFDAQPLSQLSAGCSAAGTVILYPSQMISDYVTSYGVPLVLAQNEGFAIRATVPAAGVWQFAVQTFWAETDQT